MTDIAIGSEAHKKLLCQTFIETHRPFRPEDIRWPELDAAGTARLKALPIWNEAVKTESETALKVQTLGKVEPDPVLAEAIALQGYEEGRHAAVLRLLTQHYGIPVADIGEAQPPRDPVWTFMRTGYGECIDSFFAFGLFAIGRGSGIFPAALIDIFEPIMQEEARHILFLVNWSAYLRARTPLPRRPFYDLRRAWKIGEELVGHAIHAVQMSRGGGETEEGFTMTSHAEFGDFSARSFLELCLSENDRRLSLYDSRLIRPRLVPAAVRFALKVLPRTSSQGGSREPARPS
ncbi:MAG TPA: ferritin-like domain-containing protein [Thermoanaerobaculia bacterium]